MVFCGTSLICLEFGGPMDILAEEGWEGWQLHGNLPLAVICIHWKLGRAESEQRLLSVGVAVHNTTSRMSNEGDTWEAQHKPLLS
jgi:hypothetical protein